MAYQYRLSQFSSQAYGPFGLAGPSVSSTDTSSNTNIENDTRAFTQGLGNNHGPSRSHAGLIGQPIPFVVGQFAGNTIRAELFEIQKANLGRKYARVDRRPLDPPPVVSLKLFEVTNEADSVTERELPNDEIQVLGLVCTVDLFPLPGTVPALPPTRNHSRLGPISRAEPMSPSRYVHHRRTSSGQISSSPPSPAPSRNPSQHSSTFVSTHSREPSFEEPASPSSNIVVHHVDGQPIVEGTQLTNALVGATFVQPTVVDWHGKKTLMFVFADLAVKTEGTFILRYRVFDIFSRAERHDHLVIQAECYGGPFRVYSTKEFPGLQASTELTKLISRYGVRINIRETERKRRKKGDITPDSGPATGKRKHISDDEDNDGEDG
ncbi:hypothetical protein Moror_4674 [Moniliophthora roreri MCA 2997]|uniref:Velvet domain-containing protein n=1 Tax=Moniliophthora roreri (strain MCA 2997) TaxID=1381753 RepID=V2XHG8_MONRO|nr:hypothetical protein Moror_4674 [Moniliophthora roreri MCA 2997]